MLGKIAAGALVDAVSALKALDFLCHYFVVTLHFKNNLSHFLLFDVLAQLKLLYFILEVFVEVPELTILRLAAPDLTNFDIQLLLFQSHLLLEVV